MFARRTNWNLATNRLTQEVEKHRRARLELHDLTESNPTRAGLAYDAAAILGSLADPGALDYAPDPRGLRAARESVAAYYREAGAEVRAEHVILTTSTSEAYTFLFRLLCEPDDELLIPTPSYPLFDFLAGLQDVRLVPYHLLYHEGWQIDLHAMERAITPRTRAIMVVHPNNPTGSFVSLGERARLNQLCAEHELAIVADEVFLDYAHDGKPRASFAANQAALTFALSGLSKIAALPQMKVAWIAAAGPAELREQALARLEVISDTYLSMNAPIQHALPALLAQRRSMGGQLRERIRQNLAELDAQLARQPLCARLQVEAGWYAVVRVPALGSGEDFAIALLQRAATLVQPGYFYDFPQEGFVVLSLITPTETFREGVRRMLDFVGNR